MMTFPIYGKIQRMATKPPTSFHRWVCQLKHGLFSFFLAPKAHSHGIIHFLVEHGTEMIKEFPLNPLMIPGISNPHLDSDAISEAETTRGHGCDYPSSCVMYKFSVIIDACGLFKFLSASPGLIDTVILVQWVSTGGRWLSTCDGYNYVNGNCRIIKWRTVPYVWRDFVVIFLYIALT